MSEYNGYLQTYEILSDAIHQCICLLSLSQKSRFVGDGTHASRQTTMQRHNRRLSPSFKNTQVNHSEGRDYRRREVIKGTRTDSITDYPYTVSLLNRNTNKQEWHVCGGTLIAANISEFFSMFGLIMGFQTSYFSI